MDGLRPNTDFIKVDKSEEELIEMVREALSKSIIPGKDYLIKGLMKDKQKGCEMWMGINLLGRDLANTVKRTILILYSDIVVEEVKDINDLKVFLGQDITKKDLTRGVSVVNSKIEQFNIN